MILIILICTSVALFSGLIMHLIGESKVNDKLYYSGACICILSCTVLAFTLICKVLELLE